MIRRRLCCIGISLALCAGPARAGSGGGATALPFFAEAFDPARAAQGGAFCAASCDAAALFANPAGLRGAQHEGFVSHTELGHGLQLESASLSLPLRGRAGTLAFGAGYAHLDGLTARDEQGNDLPGSVAYGALLVRAAYARELARGFSAGLSAEYLGQRIGEENGTGFGAGFGVACEAGKAEISASVEHAGPALKVATGVSEPLPFSLRGGVRVHATPGLDLSSEWSQVRGAPARASGGFAVRVLGSASFRGGYHRDLAGGDPVSGFSTGLGASHAGWSAEYGLVQDSGAGLVHRFSLRAAFGGQGQPVPQAPNAPPH